jgi:hypothetical protein
LNVYGLWLAGTIVERTVGSVRLAVVALAGGAAGLVAAGAAADDRAVVLAGGNLLAFSALAGGLCVLVWVRHLGMQARRRRGLIVPLVLLVAAQVLASMPRPFAMEVSGIGLAVAAAVAVVLTGLVPAVPPAWVARVLRAVLGILVAGAALGVVQVAREDVESFVLGRRARVLVHGGVRFLVPPGFRVAQLSENDGPVVSPEAGIIDGLEARTGGVVQYLVVQPEAEHEAEHEPVLFELEPTLRRELTATPLDRLPRPFVDALGDTPHDAFALRQNGVSVARVVERRLPTGVVVVVVAAPGEALGHAPALYGAILADAAEVDGASERPGS